MSKRNVLIVVLALCAMLTVGFVAGTASRATPTPPYTLTPFGAPDDNFFLLTDSRSSTIRLIVFQRTVREQMPGPSIVDGSLALTVLAEFNLDKLSRAEQAPADSPAKP